MKKNSIIILTTLVALSFILTGCGRQKQVMDRPAIDGKYHYENKDLGFTLTLPKEFEYYQTQRKESQNKDYIDLEIFVPTSDVNYPQEVSGYGKPVIIRVTDKKTWESDLFEKSLVEKIGEKGEKTYAIVFWLEIPNDWESKWTESLKQEIKDNFKIL